MQKLQINIFTTDLIWMGMVDAVESLVHRTSWHEIPSSEMSISKTAQGVDELQIGRILVVNNQKDKQVADHLSMVIIPKTIFFSVPGDICICVSPP